MYKVDDSILQKMTKKYAKMSQFHLPVKNNQKFTQKTAKFCTNSTSPSKETLLN